MALFARRTLQRVLNENALFLTVKQLSKVAKLLDAPHEHYLATEWEQVTLNAASKLGTVQHEPVLGKSAPDLLFRANDGKFEFIADITTASDKGFHDLNPVDAFQEEFRRRVKKSNWRGGGFDIRVDPLTQNIYRGMAGRIRLKLPKRSQWNKEIFGPGFLEFLRKIQRQPELPHHFDVVSAIAGIHIKYDPKRRGFSGGGYPSFAIATSLERNPVYGALKAKGDQLKKANYRGIAGVFLCDGSCQMLQSPQTHSSFTIDEIVWHFFKQFDSVWFVVVFTIEEKRWGSDISIDTKLYLNPRKPKEDSTALHETINGIFRSMPRPEWSALSALYRIKDGELAGKYYGRLSSGGAVKMSSRELLEILAGVKTVAQFERNYRMTPESNPFRQMLAEGRLICKVTIDNLPENDDDSVTIEFGPRDSAVASFQVPTT